MTQYSLLYCSIIEFNSKQLQKMAEFDHAPTVSNFEAVINSGCIDIINVISNTISLRDMVALSRTSWTLHNCLHELFDVFKDLTKISFEPSAKSLTMEKCIKASAHHLYDYFVRKIGIANINFIYHADLSIENSVMTDHLQKKYSDEISEAIKKNLTSRNKGTAFLKKISLNSFIITAIQCKHIGFLNLILKSIAGFNLGDDKLFSIERYVIAAIETCDINIYRMIVTTFRANPTTVSVKRIFEAIGAHANSGVFLRVVKRVELFNANKSNIATMALANKKFEFLRQIWPYMTINAAFSLELLKVVCNSGDPSIIKFFLDILSTRLTIDPTTVTDSLIHSAILSNGSLDLFIWLLTFRPDYLNADIVHMSGIIQYMLHCGRMELIKYCLETTKLSEDQLDWSRVQKESDQTNPTFTHLCIRGDINAVKYIINTPVINGGVIDYAGAWREVLLNELFTESEEIIELLKAAGAASGMSIDHNICLNFESDCPDEMCPVMRSVTNGDFSFAMDYVKCGGCSHLKETTESAQRFIAKLLEYYVGFSHDCVQIDFVMTYVIDQNQIALLFIDELFEQISPSNMINPNNLRYVCDRLGINIHDIYRQFAELITVKKDTVFCNTYLFIEAYKSGFFSDYTTKELFRMTMESFTKENILSDQTVKILDTIRHKPDASDIEYCYDLSGSITDFDLFEDYLCLLAHEF